MEIWIDADNKAHLRCPDDFTEFAVLTEATSQGSAASTLRELGVLDGNHVFVDQTWLIAHAGEAADDSSWRSGFDAMVAYASSKGWLDAAGRIRAHIRVSEVSRGFAE